MIIQIAKWGDSLALRIPRKILKQAELREGDYLNASLVSDGSIVLRAEKMSRKVLILELQEFRKTIDTGKSVMSELRNKSRF
jgi:antitoxin MazE